MEARMKPEQFNHLISRASAGELLSVCADCKIVSGPILLVAFIELQ